MLAGPMAAEAFVVVVPNLLTSPLYSLRIIICVVGDFIIAGCLTYRYMASWLVGLLRCDKLKLLFLLALDI